LKNEKKTAALPGLSRKPHIVVTARRDGEAIRLLSGIYGLLHFVRNDGTGLLRHSDIDDLRWYGLAVHLPIPVHQKRHGRQALASVCRNDEAGNFQF
jgi:hypothetical protein